MIFASDTSGGYTLTGRSGASAIRIVIFATWLRVAPVSVPEYVRSVKAISQEVLFLIPGSRLEDNIW